MQRSNNGIKQCKTSCCISIYVVLTPVKLYSRPTMGWFVEVCDAATTANTSHNKVKYRVAPKMAVFWYALTSSNINRFSKLFHCQNQDKIYNTITKDPTTPQVCRYTTLWNVKCLKSNNRKQDDFYNNTFLIKLTIGNNVFIVSVII